VVIVKAVAGELIAGLGGLVDGAAMADGATNAAIKAARLAQLLSLNT
jgi:hypothetical protein